MRLLGLRSAHLRTIPVPDAACPTCARTALQLRLTGHYAHVLGLPLFVTRKTATGYCLQCRQPLSAPQLPEPLQQPLRTLPEQVQAPLWCFAGLLLAALLLLLAPAQRAWHRYQYQRWLTHPHVGDVYQVRSEAPGYFTLMQVVAVNGNSVRLRMNALETDEPTELDDLNRPRNYASSEPFELTQLDLRIMQVQHELLGVRRP